MHSNIGADNQNAPRQTFIEAARRAQITAAAIETLAQVGYGKASLAQIAKRANITPSLISYHFADKDTLLAQTLEAIASAWDGHIHAAVAASGTPTEQLHSYIAASLSYMGTRPTYFAALIEIAFNARTPNGELLYRSAAEEPGLTLLKAVLVRGQQSGAFRQFDVHAMALAIRGAINEFFGAMHMAESHLERYTAELVELFTRATAA